MGLAFGRRESLLWLRLRSSDQRYGTVSQAAPAFNTAPYRNVPGWIRPAQTLAAAVMRTWTTATATWTRTNYGMIVSGRCKFETPMVDAGSPGVPGFIFAKKARHKAGLEFGAGDSRLEDQS